VKVARERVGQWTFVIAVFLGLTSGILFCPVLRAQLSTPDHLSDPGFWPTKPGYSRSEYAGPEACAGCHKAIYSTQIDTSMALTASHAPASKILASHSNLKFATGPVRYSISMKNSQPVYDMTSSGKKLTAFLTWAFGTGRVGQSYLFAAKDGAFREARVTYFSSLHNLDFTPARSFTKVNSPEEAMYRVVGPNEVQRCFGCHTTAAFTTNHLDQENLFLGVTCEACHGPGAKHVATMQSFVLAGASPSGPLDIFNPDSLSPQDAVDFCGACHAATWDVLLARTKGVANARSAPYRLQRSKCWGKGDARLLCWSCHNPHEQVRSDPESYDRACFNCHASSAQAKSAAAANQPPCPVATSKCVSCHMQKVYVPEMHFNFTDHRIRIVQAGSGYEE
jgi:hypothetical protein